MPHVMTLIPGGTAFVPTQQKLDDLKALCDEIYDWVEATMIPDTLALAPYYSEASQLRQGLRPLHRLGRLRARRGLRRRYIEQMKNRYHAHGRPR